MATNFTNSNISTIQLQGENYKLKSVPFHASENEWSSGEMKNYIPKQGEFVVYDVDANYSYQRFKIGDGVSTVENLPFGAESSSDGVEIDTTLSIAGAAADAATVGEKLDNLEHAYAIDQGEGAIVFTSGPYTRAEGVSF